MSGPSVSITLYGEEAQRFKEIAEEVEEVSGFKPSNADVARELMREFDEREYRR